VLWQAEQRSQAAYELLTLAHSYEFAERLSNFTEPFRNRRQQKE